MLDLPHTSDLNLRPAPASCWRCGYSLAGLTQAQVCPECGLATHLSVEQRMLGFAPRAMVQRIRVGVGILFAGLLSALVVLASARYFIAWTTLAFVAMNSIGWIVAAWSDDTGCDDQAERRDRRATLRVTALPICVMLIAVWPRLAGLMGMPPIDSRIVLAARLALPMLFMIQTGQGLLYLAGVAGARPKSLFKPTCSLMAASSAAPDTTCCWARCWSTFSLFCRVSVEYLKPPWCLWGWGGSLWGSLMRCPESSKFFGFPATSPGCGASWAAS